MTMQNEKIKRDKESAVLFALQNDMALIRRDLEIHSMKKDGSTALISRSNDYESL